MTKYLKSLRLWSLLLSLVGIVTSVTIFLDGLSKDLSGQGIPPDFPYRVNFYLFGLSVLLILLSWSRLRYVKVFIMLCVAMILLFVAIYQIESPQIKPYTRKYLDGVSVDSCLQGKRLFIWGSIDIHRGSDIYTSNQSQCLYHTGLSQDVCRMAKVDGARNLCYEIFASREVNFNVAKETCLLIEPPHLNETEFNSKYGCIFNLIDRWYTFEEQGLTEQDFIDTCNELGVPYSEVCLSELNY